MKKPRAPAKLKKAVPSSSPSVQQSPSSTRAIDVSSRDRLQASSSGTLHPRLPPVSAMQPTTALSRAKRPANPLSQVDTSKLSNKKQKMSQKLSTETSASSVHSRASDIPSVRHSVPSLVKQSSRSMAPPPVPNLTKPQIGSERQIPACVQLATNVSRKPSTFVRPGTIRKHPALCINSLSEQPSPNIANAVLAPQIIETGFKAKLPSKRFRPLMLNKGPTFPRSENAAEKSYKEVSTNFISAVKTKSSTTVPLRHLDFPQLSSDSLVLVPITLPPKISNRKHVHPWSVILSRLSDEERRQCVLVSRMFRYSVYLSAVHLLEEKFNGRRLASLMLKYPRNMTNMWPYLRQRDLEVQMRMQEYNRSFLAKYFKDFEPISEHLRKSPDNERQMTVAVRFILTRLWFSVSIGGGSDPLAFSCGKVVDAHEVVKDEIWIITVQTGFSQPHGISASQTETFYVLEQTCEVLGRPSPPAHVADSSVASDKFTSLSNTPKVRADWSAYIAHRQLPLSAHDTPPLPLLAYLKWQNHEEYHRGLSKLWLKNIADEGELGVAKRIVADRYVLACVVGNSVSGRWMTSTQMEQTFSGNTAIVPTRVQSQQVHLFLPAHHHVESVHFTATNGRPLHMALAVVQTPGREYYILRDNGAQVGCGLGEEDGVAPLWMELLGCTALGETTFCP